MNQTPAVTWHVVIPVKGVAGAKTRLAPPHGVDRGRLALAMALDTIEAVCRVTSPDRVHVVTGDRQLGSAAKDLGTDVVPEPDGGGLLGAVATGLDQLAADSPTAVLLGDLPALRPHQLRRALAVAGQHQRAFVPDRQGTGTVLLAGAPGIRHEPHFGTGSAAAHERAGYARLELSLPSLRTDVDVAEDLAAVLRMGVGRHTTALLGAAIDATA